MFFIIILAFFVFKIIINTNHYNNIHRWPYSYKCKYNHQHKTNTFHRSDTGLTNNSRSSVRTWRQYIRSCKRTRIPKPTSHPLGTRHHFCMGTQGKCRPLAALVQLYTSAPPGASANYPGIYEPRVASDLYTECTHFERVMEFQKSSSPIGGYLVCMGCGLLAGSWDQSFRLDIGSSNRSLDLCIDRLYEFLIKLIYLIFITYFKLVYILFFFI